MYNRLIFDHEMKNFLDRSHNIRISQILIHGMSGLIKEEGNFIKREEGKIDTLSYLPSVKYNLIQNDYSKDPFGPGIGRVSIKIGRFVRKFLSESSFSEFSIKDSDVENFVNIYKSYFNYDPSKLKIIEGEEIKKYYLESNYFKPDGCQYGTLWNSCMRQSDRNKFMNLYTVNKDIKMLVLLSDDGAVRSRALLWDNVKEFNSDKVYKFMDRIYSVYDHDVNIFKKWASDNGYVSKWEQSAKSELFIDIDGRSERKNLYVILDNHNLSYYPYLDTFKFYDVSKGRFSNSQSYNFDYTLIQSNGMVERQRDNDDDEVESLWDFDDDDEF
jgi:hypothetical protein